MLKSLKKFYSEVKFLARHLMIAVECDISIIGCSNCCREWPSQLVRKSHFVAGNEIFRALYDALLYSDDHLRSRHAVCFLRHQMHVDNISHFHITDSKVESRYHHSGSADELQRLAAVV